MSAAHDVRRHQAGHVPLHGSKASGNDHRVGEVARAAMAPARLTPQAVAAVQRVAGNAALTRLLQGRGGAGSAATSGGPPQVQRGIGFKSAAELERERKAQDSKKEPAPAEGPSLLPAVEAVSKTLTSIKAIATVVQEFTHDNVKTGRVILPPMVAGGKSADYQPMYDLERIFIFDMATEICKRAFAIGLAHGIDFHQIGPDGKLITPAPSTAAKPPSNTAQGQQPAAGQSGPTGLAKAASWDDDTVKALTLALGSLQDLAQQDIKALVKSGLEQKIEAVNLPPGHFFWDADDNHGEHEMTDGEEVRGNLSGAWGRLSASVVIERINGGAMGGMPDDAKHFGIPASATKLNPVWVTGGAIDWTTKNDLDITVDTTPQPHMQAPTGAYQIHSTWKWDESTSIMECLVTPAGASFTLLADVKLSGAKPDDGWV
jgi:hypothetical protein